MRPRLPGVGRHARLARSGANAAPLHKDVGAIEPFRGDLPRRSRSMGRVRGYGGPVAEVGRKATLGRGN